MMPMARGRGMMTRELGPGQEGLWIKAEVGVTQGEVLAILGPGLLSEGLRESWSFKTDHFFRQAS